MKNILILTDYRGAFYSTFATRNTSLSMDTELLVERLAAFGYNVELCKFAQLDLAANYKGIYVLYTSSEDEGLTYKSYIEDVVLYLDALGAKVLPGYKFLRAHHNKSMMELLRYQLFPESARKIGTQVLGTLEELMVTRKQRGGGWPKVIKSAYGAGAGLVGAVHNEDDLLRVARRYSRSDGGFIMEVKEYFKERLRPNYQRRSSHRSKYIVQEMISGLAGDFKVLCMGRRYYCLYRKNRKNDFRASGSGLFTWEISHVVDELALLDFSEKIYKTLSTPVASLDIGFDGKSFHLIEFQVMHFGTLTAEKSDFYYCKDEIGGWKKVSDVCVIEEVLADAVDLYIRNSCSI